MRKQKDYSKYNIEIRQGKHLVMTCESVKQTVRELKELTDLPIRDLFTRVYEYNKPKPKYKVYGDRSKPNGDHLYNNFSKIGVYHLKLVSKHNPVKLMTDMELVVLYKKENANIRLKDQAFSELVRRYAGLLKNQANRMFTSIPISYFAYDFEDCEYEARYCLKLAIEYFDISKVGSTFNSHKFNLSYYIESEMKARISSYWWKFNKKKKRNVEYEVHDFSVQTDDDHNYSEIVEDPRNMESESDCSLLFQKLDSVICSNQKKIKQFLMEGIKETKIRSMLKLNKSQYFSYKEQLKKNMVMVGLVV